MSPANRSILIRSSIRRAVSDTFSSAAPARRRRFWSSIFSRSSRQARWHPFGKGAESVLLGRSDQGLELADQAAAEQQHADDEDRAENEVYPLAHPGEPVRQHDHEQRADGRD